MTNNNNNHNFTTNANFRMLRSRQQIKKTQNHQNWQIQLVLVQKLTVV